MNFILNNLGLTRQTPATRKPSSSKNALTFALSPPCNSISRFRTVPPHPHCCLARFARSSRRSSVMSPAKDPTTTTVFPPRRAFSRRNTTRPVAPPSVAEANSAAESSSGPGGRLAPSSIPNGFPVSPASPPCTGTLVFFLATLLPQWLENECHSPSFHGKTTPGSVAARLRIAADLRSRRTMQVTTFARNPGSVTFPRPLSLPTRRRKLVARDIIPCADTPAWRHCCSSRPRPAAPRPPHS